MLLSKVTRSYFSVCDLSFNMSCFFFDLWLSDAIIHVPNVILVSMLVKMPLDIFLYLTIDEENQIKHTVTGGSS